MITRSWFLNLDSLRKHLNLSLQSSAVAMLLFAVTPAGAQSTGLLYDPEPPVNSAYVRVILASQEGPVDVLVDGKPRLQGLAGGGASDYLVLPSGKHAVALRKAGKVDAAVSMDLDAISGRAFTVAFTGLQGGLKPLVFEDKANSNKLKAVLAVYHLDARSGPLDLLTADGATRVFSGLEPGASRTLSVNPITIELSVAKSLETLPQAKVSLAMSQGGTYSILLLPAAKGGVSAIALQNKVERYTGK